MAPSPPARVERTQTSIQLPPVRRPSLGLRIQVLLGLAVVALFAVISTGALSLWAAADGLRLQREATATAIAAAAASAISAAQAPSEKLSSVVTLSRIAPILSQLLEASGLVEVSVMDANNRVVASRPLRDPADVDPPVALASLAGVPSILNYRTGGSGDTELLAYAPVLSGQKVMGMVRVVLMAPPPMIGFLAKSGSMLVGLALGNAVLLVALGYLLITSLVVRPLRVVEQATARVTSDGADATIHVEGPREIESLAASFNRMTASLASQREQLIRTEKLASVGQLSAGVAHEIGNPLAAILGYADILKVDAEDPAAATLSVEERLNIASRIKSETQRIHRTISDLLEYSRPSRDEARPTDPLMVARSARDLVSPMGSRLRSASVVIAGEGDAGSWPRVVASPERLKQVLVNLLLNAADAIVGEGTITIATELSDDRVALKISDTGPGVPAELHRRIFDPFFSTKDPGKGTGLGLSISRSIVETFGGTLELQAPNPPEAGATFVISMLRAAPEGETPDA